MDKTNNKIMFNVDDLVSDVQSLKISALTNAAKISPYVSEVTIGPRRKSELDLENIKENLGDQQLNIFKPDLKVTIQNQSPNTLKNGKKQSPKTDHNYSRLQANCCPRSVKVLDCKSVSYKYHLIDAEKQRAAKVKLEIAERQALVDETERKIQERCSATKNQAEKNVTKKVLESEQKLLETLELEEQRAKEYNEKKKLELKEQNERMLEKSKVVKREEEIRKKREQELKQKRDEIIKKQNHYFETIKNAQILFGKFYEKIANSILSVDKEELFNYLHYNDNVKKLAATFDTIFQTIKTSKITEVEVSTALKLCESIQTISTCIEEQIRLSNANKVELQRLKEQQEVQLKSTTTAPPPSTNNKFNEFQLHSNQDENNQLQTSSVTSFNNAISSERLNLYSQLINFNKEYSDNIKPLMDDDVLKKFRFDCQKAINIPVNAISAVSPQHLIDKLDKLVALLSGKQVNIGNNSCDATKHPLGIPFCTYLLAKKFVNQAETMVSSNAQAAFPIAGVILSLWQQYTDFGQLFLARIYLECPYLVPYFIPHMNGQTVQDYCLLLGYRLIDGVLEEQDMYLKRVLGIARLYFTLLITKSRNVMQMKHPHGIENGWIWMANFLNGTPLPEICATLLYEFIQICGYEMWQNYGKNFIKLLNLLKNIYFPILNQIDVGGPKSRLEVLLNKITKEGRIDAPQGRLELNFW